MPNIYAEFKALIPSAPQLLAKVVAVEDQFSVVQFLGGENSGGLYGYNGDVVRVLGSSTVGNVVYVRDGVILGDAPNLPVEEIVIYGL